MSKKTTLFAADFETTVYEGQERTDVWASALTELFDETESVEIHHSIDETFDYLLSLNTNIIAYYHNLKFDGSFWIDFLLNKARYSLAMEYEDDKPVGWLSNKNMPSKTFKCSISTMGQWYTIVIKNGRQIIELRDSYKLLPFSVERIGKAFKTKHQKLSMEYKGFRYPGCTITDDEKGYIKNDVLVMKEALEFMFTEGHDKLTIGACCLSEFKSFFSKEDYNCYFPNLYEIPLEKEIYGYDNVGEYIRSSYAGGWCYLVKGKQNKVYHDGCTADVNSLYPSMMSSESGNYYPIGKPEFVNLKGADEKTIKFWCKLVSRCSNDRYFFIRIRTRFHLKGGKLPFIHLRNTFRFKQNECVETTDWIGKDGKRYKNYWFGKNKEELTLHDTAVTMTLTQTDFKLFTEHYNTENLEILDLCYFSTAIGLFDEYMTKYKEIKQNSKGAMRELAKLFLNNLYGKMAASTDSSYKVPMLRDDTSVGLYDVTENDKKPGYIPVGSAITSYARNFTIRAAQLNYHGANNRGFIYADTDSIHCDLKPHEVDGITIHETDFCCWKLECEWDKAIFARQKTYIEHVVVKDGENVSSPYYDIKCAGMPKQSKEIFEKSLNHYQVTEEDEQRLGKDGVNIIKSQYTLEDFKIGLKLPGKMMPKRIPGGTLLVETTYEMR